MSQVTPEIIKDTIGWDIVNWTRSLDYWQKHTQIDLANSQALELGSGGDNGGISLYLAAQGSELLCSNYGGVFEYTKAYHQKHGVAEQVRYDDVNALTMSYENQFDIVTFKSILGGIGINDEYQLQKESIQRMYDALKPGGELWFAENLVSTKMHQFLRDRFGAGKIAWRYITTEEIGDLFAPFSDVQFETFGFLGALGRNEGQRSILGKLDQTVFDLVVPKSWHYIVTGIARKSH